VVTTFVENPEGRRIFGPFGVGLLNRNKKFCVETIAYFSLMRHGEHRK
jgi:hypothetical protein